jgi:hypothetical protein
MRRFGKLLLALLRELADQNSYQRHLAAHGREHSAAEWRRFSEHRLQAKYSQAKCCQKTAPFGHGSVSANATSTTSTC